MDGPGDGLGDTHCVLVRRLHCVVQCDQAVWTETCSEGKISAEHVSLWPKAPARAESVTMTVVLRVMLDVDCLGLRTDHKHSRRDPLSP